MSARELTALCHRIARQGPLWVQGQGGNLSIKTGDRMLIKASGLRLDEIHPGHGLVPLAIARVKKEIFHIRGKNDKAEQAYAAVLKSSGSTLRPSMEAGIHLALPGRIVMHFHSLPALLMAFEFKRNRRRMSTWLKNNWEEKFCFVKPFRPGLLLSRVIRKNREARLFILENHGVVIQSGSSRVLEAWAASATAVVPGWEA